MHVARHKLVELGFPYDERQQAIQPEFHMYAKVKQIIASYWLLLFFFLIAVTIVLSDVSFEDLLSTLLTLQAWQFGLLVLVFFLATGVHIASRKYLFYALGARCRLTNLIHIHFATMAAHYSTPVKIGIPIAIYLFNKIENIEYSRSTAMILVEIVVGTSLCGLIAIIGIPVILGISLNEALLYFILLGTGGLVAAGIAGYWYRNFGKRHAILNYFYDTLATVRRIRPLRMAFYLALSLLLRLLDGLNLFLLCVFFSEELTLWQSVITTSTAFFVGTISMVPMGLGTRDISMLLLLQHYQVSGDSALLIVSLQRILTTGLSFVLGIYCGSVLGVKKIAHSATIKHENQSRVNKG